MSFQIVHGNCNKEFKLLAGIQVNHHYVDSLGHPRLALELRQEFPPRKTISQHIEDERVEMLFYLDFPSSISSERRKKRNKTRRIEAETFSMCTVFAEMELCAARLVYPLFNSHTHNVNGTIRQ